MRPACVMDMDGEGGEGGIREVVREHATSRTKVCVAPELDGASHHHHIPDPTTFIHHREQARSNPVCSKVRRRARRSEEVIGATEAHPPHHTHKQWQCISKSKSTHFTRTVSPVCVSFAPSPSSEFPAACTRISPASFHALLYGKDQPPTLF